MNVDPKEMAAEEAKNLVANKLVKLSEEIATILILASKDEGHLLDGIRIANEGIRTLACEGFVKWQKVKGKA